MGCTQIVASLAPQSQAVGPWSAHDTASTQVIDHSRWARFLAQYTSMRDGIRRVDYAAARASGRTELDAYVEGLVAIDPRALTRNEQLAFWINLYNAETVRVVLDHYPVASIQDIDLQGSGLFGGPWDAPRIALGDEKLSLNNIEHNILRPLWQDPRIHYAVNCASLGCPDLSAMPYTSGTVDALLDTQARTFVNHPRGVDVSDNRLRLSTVYQWYRYDFGQSDSEIIAHVSRFATAELQGALEAFDDIDTYDYDWRLNDPETPYP